MGDQPRIALKLERAVNPRLYLKPALTELVAEALGDVVKQAVEVDR